MEYFSLQELNLPKDIWAPFAAHYQARRYRTGQIIYLQDTTARHFYYLKSGRVKTYSSSAEGVERVLNIYHSGSLFGEASFFDELPRVSSAVAMTECAIVPIDRQMAVEEMSANPELTLALLKYLARTVRLLSSQVDNMAFLRADQRLARYLLTLPREADGLIRCSQDELASAISASRVTVNRTLQRFAQEGLVETEYGGVRILNPQGLAAC